jgi:hypothetical protein
MQSFIKRHLTDTLKTRLKNNPAAAILGPRQCGKSTLAGIILGLFKNSIYLDLESPSDLRKISDIESFFELNRKCLICLDEVQRAPEIFPALRSLLDKNAGNGRLLILGSASRDLLRQSSESLAGRISYLELTPFLNSEVNKGGDIRVMRELWLKGGFPRSYLTDASNSFMWRSDFIRTYLERDIPQLGFSIPAASIRRVWTMCAHSHGQILNYSKIGESLGVSHNTVRSYIEILAQTFLVRILPPYSSNLKKRIVKTPKIYIRDTGLLHALLGIESMNDLFGHPVYGFSWEGFALENILSELPDWNGSFYRSSSGSELDLILEKGAKKIAVEFKSSSAPELSRGFFNSLEDLDNPAAWVIAPVDEPYPIKKKVTVSPLNHFIDSIRKIK